MLKIFHAPRARSLRLVWLCEEMGAPYEIAPVEFGKPSPEFLAANPLGALPAVTDGDVCMIESIAIMLYIMSKYGPTDLALRPEDRDYAKYLQFLIFGEAGLAMYGNPLVATKFRAPEDKRNNWTADYLKETLRKRIAFVERELGDADYIAGGRFTAADISIFYSLGMAAFASGEDPFPLHKALAAYRERLTQRPAYKRAITAA